MSQHSRFKKFQELLSNCSNVIENYNKGISSIDTVEKSIGNLTAMIFVLNNFADIEHKNIMKYCERAEQQFYGQLGVKKVLKEK